MADLLIRNLDPEAHAFWKEQARINGLSLSDQVKAVLISWLVREGGRKLTDDERDLLRRAGRLA